MQDANTDSAVALSHYSRVLRRRWRVVLLGALLGLWVAIAYLWVVPQQVAATTTVSLNIITTDPFNLARSASGLIDIEGEAQVAGSSVVAQRAADALGENVGGEEMWRSLEVTGVTDTSILRISVSASTEAGAQAAADAVAAEYLSYRSEQAQTRIDRNLASSRSRLESLREDLATANEALAAAAEDSQELTQAEADRSLVTLEINTLLEQVASTQGIDTAAGSVLSPANRNPVVRTPSRGLVLITGLLVGLALGVLVAFLRNPLRARLRSDQDVVESGGRLVLGTLTGREVGMLPKDEELEALRTIRERIFANAPGALSAGVCGIIDECPPGRADDVPFKLAYVMAQTGLPVEFIGPEMSPDTLRALASSWDLRRGDGLAGGGRYLSERCPGLSVFLPPTEGSPTADEPLSRSVRDEIAAQRAGKLIVLAVPSSATEATRLAATRLSNKVVFVAAQGATRLGTLRRANDEVTRIGGEVLGTILLGRHRSVSMQGDRTSSAATSRAEAKQGAAAAG